MSVKRALWILLAICLLFPCSYALWLGMAFRDIWLRDGMVNAARAGDARTIEQLMSIGASPSPVGWEEHVTPLGGATQCGQVGVVRLLLRRGANVNERDDHRETALTLARRCRQAQIAQLLTNAGGHE